MRDVLATMLEMERLARHRDPQIRAATLRYAIATSLVVGQLVLVAALDDEDIRVASLAASGLVDEGFRQPSTFDALARLIPRLPGKPRDGGSIGVEQAPVVLSQAEVAGKLINARGSRPIGELMTWLPAMDATGRARVAGLIAQEKVITAETRNVLVELVGDRSQSVRRPVIEVLRKVRLAPSEATAIEALLTRSATDLRRGAITLLATLPPGQARQSAERLALSSDARQRAAATELARLLGSVAEAGEQAPSQHAQQCRGRRVLHLPPHPWPILRPVLGMHGEDDPQLSAWINDHLRIIAVPVPDAHKLGAIEATVLDALDPPLNLRGRQPTPARARLTELRRQRHAGPALKSAGPTTPQPRPSQAAEPSMNQAERQFYQAMIGIYETAKRELGYNATRFLQMISQHGGVATARQLLWDDHPHDVFTTLWSHSRLDLTVEAHVLREEFDSLFTDADRQRARDRARDRLTAYGWHEGP